MRLKRLLRLALFMPMSILGVGGGGAPLEGDSENTSDSTDTSTDNQNNTDSQDQKEPEKMFTQKDVNRMMKAEKESGKKSVLKELGFADIKSAEEGIKAYQAYVEAQKTDLQKAQDAATLANTEKAEAENRAAVAEACLTAIRKGVKSDCVDDLVAIALAKVTDEVSLEDVIEGLQKNAAFSGFFTATEDPSKKKGTGSPLGNKGTKPTQTPETNYGKELAQRLKARQKGTENPYFK